MKVGYCQTKPLETGRAFVVSFAAPLAHTPGPLKAQQGLGVGLGWRVR